MFNLWIAFAANIVCICILVYAVYFPRYQRRDLALAYIGLNIGIMLVTMLLTGSDAGLGLGLGLFGILSIIRLRSDTLTQGEIGYYFAALVLGLMNGLHPDPAWLSPVLSAVLVAVMYAADHPRISPRTRRQSITLDRAYANETELKTALETLLQGKVMRIEVQELDLVRDLTVVDVRFKGAAPVSARHDASIHKGPEETFALPATAFEATAFDNNNSGYSAVRSTSPAVPTRAPAVTASVDELMGVRS